MDYFQYLLKIFNPGYILTAGTIVLLLLFSKKSKQGILINILSINNYIFSTSSMIVILYLVMFRSGNVNIKWIATNVFLTLMVFLIPHLLALSFWFKKLNTSKALTSIIALLLINTNFIANNNASGLFPYPGQDDPTFIVMPSYQVDLIYVSVYLIFLTLTFGLSKLSHRAVNKDALKK
jgi:hypothetical protein